MSRTSDRAAFVRAVVESPHDVLPRLAYADWLQERRFDDQKAELIRVQVELAADYPAHERSPAVAAEDWHVGHEPGACRGCALLARQTELIRGAFPPKRQRTQEFMQLADRVDVRDVNLWAAVCVAEQWSQPWPFAPPGHFGDAFARGLVRRGFVERAAMRLDAWLGYGADLVKTQPVIEVAATDVGPGLMSVRPEFFVTPMGYRDRRPADWPHHWLPVDLMPAAEAAIRSGRAEYLDRSSGTGGVWVGFDDADAARGWLCDSLVDIARAKAGLPPVFRPEEASP